MTVRAVRAVPSDSASWYTPLFGVRLWARRKNRNVVPKVQACRQVSEPPLQWA